MAVWMVAQTAERWAARMVAGMVEKMDSIEVAKMACC